MDDKTRQLIAKAISQLEDAKAILEACATDERAAYEDLPSKAKEADDAENDAIWLEESVDELDGLINKLNEE